MRDYQVVMPKLGLTMTKATLAEWHKPDGEWVEKGEPLFTIETEKVTLEIEAPASGILRSLVAAGQTVPVMQPVATLLSSPVQTLTTLKGILRSRNSPSAMARILSISFQEFSGRLKMNISTFSNWWTLNIPLVSRPWLPASVLKQGEIPV